MNNKVKAILKEKVFDVLRKQEIDFTVEGDCIMFSPSLYYNFNDGGNNLKDLINYLKIQNKKEKLEELNRVISIFTTYLDCNDFEVVLGPNSKQWWIYSNRFDVWIDPPKEVLSKLSKDQEEAEKELYALVKTLPNWLFDIYYWYDAEMYDI